MGGGGKHVEEKGGLFWAKRGKHVEVRGLFCGGGTHVKARGLVWARGGKHVCWESYALGND